MQSTTDVYRWSAHLLAPAEIKHSHSRLCSRVCSDAILCASVEEIPHCKKKKKHKTEDKGRPHIQKIAMCISDRKTKNSQRSARSSRYEFACVSFFISAAFISVPPECHVHTAAHVSHESRQVFQYISHGVCVYGDI